MHPKHELLCYCFSHTRKDIEDDFKENGKSTIMEEIMASSKDGKCHCRENNPKGR